MGASMGLGAARSTYDANDDTCAVSCSDSAEDASRSTPDEDTAQGYRARPSNALLAGGGSVHAATTPWAAASGSGTVVGWVWAAGAAPSMS